MKTALLKKVCVLLINDDEQIENLDYREKEDFLGFYEEIALMNQSRLLSDAMMHYMFGYYALAAYSSKSFSSNINLRSTYWSLFCLLCERLERLEQNMRGGATATTVGRLRF